MCRILTIATDLNMTFAWIVNRIDPNVDLTMT